MQISRVSNIWQDIISKYQALLDQQALSSNLCFSSDWTYNDGTTSNQGACKSYTCGARGTFFGYLESQAYLERIFTNLDAHTKLKIELTFIKLEQFNDDKFIIKVDGTQYYVSYSTNGIHTGISTQYAFSNELSSNECTISQAGIVAGADAQIDLDLTISHTASSLTIRFYRDYFSTTGLWGLRNVKISLEVDCNIGCNKCTTPDQCTVCAYNRITIPTCKCPDAYYDNGQPECAKCLSKCATCTNATTCATCSTNRTGTNCDCKDGTYESNGNCLDCLSKCATCTDSTTCSTCASHRSGTNCDCDELYYESAGQCIACSSNCQTCDKTTGTCLTCISSDRTPPTCSCPTKTYELNGTCVNCLSTCLTCNSSDTCLTCSSDRNGSQCVCNTGTYSDANGDCKSCLSSCLTCDNGATCLSCKGSNRLGTKCECIDGTYESNGECLSCPQYCYNCDSNGCTSCPDLQMSLPLCSCPQGYLISNKTCVKNSETLDVIARISNDLKWIELEFTDNISIAHSAPNVAQSANCDVIQSPTSTKCYLNNKIFYIYIPSSMEVSIGMDIKLVDDGINLINQSGSKFQTLSLQAPNSPESVSFTVQYNNNIVSCQQAQIKVNVSSGIGNKKPTIKIGEYGNSDSVILPKLSQSQDIKISVTNYLGTVNSQTITISVQSNDAPSIQLEQLIGDLYAYTELNIQAQLQVLTCDSNSTIQQFTYQYYIDNEPEAIQSSTIQMLSLTIPSNKFKANTQHNITIKATYNSIEISDSMIISIKQAPILVSIVGGSRLVSAQRDITLKGVVIDAENQGYTTKWNCKDTTTSNDCSSLLTTDLVQTIKSGTLNTETTYQFTLTAYSTSQSQSRSITLLIQSSLQQDIQLQYPARYNTMSVNLDEQLMFVVQIIQNGVTYQIDSSSTLKYNILEGQVVVYSKTVSSSVVSFKLSDIIQEGTQFTIQFVFDTLVSFLTINVNQPPSGGTFECEDGISLTTQYKMQLLDYEDTDIPLQYKFSMILDDGEELPLSDWQNANNYFTILPQGVYPDYRLTIVGYVSDSRNAITKVQKSIISKPSGRRLLQQDDNQEIIMFVYEYQQMQANPCAKSCSNHGTCSENACTCDEGYYLDDCSKTQEEFNALVTKLNSILDQLQGQSDQSLTQIQQDKLTKTIKTILARQEIVDSINSDQVSQNLDKTTSSLSNLFSDSSISKASIENLTTQMPNTQKQRRSLQVNNNVQSQTSVIDKLFSATSYNTSSKYNSSSAQNEINQQLMTSSKTIQSFYASQLLADQDPITINGSNMNIKAQKLTQGQSAQYFPYVNYLFSTLDEDELAVLNEIGMADDVEMSTGTYNTNPYCADDQFPYQNQSNQLVGLNFKDSSGNPTKPRRQLSYTLKVKQSENNICVTQNDNGEWTSSGCSTFNSLIADGQQCSCDSITEITIVDDIAEMFKNSNIDALWNPGALADFAFWESALFYISVVLTGCWIVCIIIGWRRDTVDLKLYVKAEQDEIQKKAAKLDEEKKLNDDEDSDEEYKQKQKELQENRKIVRDFMYGFPMLHQFISIFTMFSDEQPRPARFTIYFLKMIIMMALTSLFGKNLSITQNVVFTVMCVALMAPITAALLKGFAHDASKIKKILSVVFIVIIFGGCWYVCLVVAAKMGVEESNSWSITYLLSLACDIIIMEGMTVFLKLVLVPYIKARIHSGNFMIRIMYLYLFERNMELILSKIQG